MPIEEKQISIGKLGAKSIFWATKEVTTTYGERPVQAFASKSGTGKVVLIQTNMVVSPFTYIFKIKRPEREFEWLKSFYEKTEWYKILQQGSSIEDDLEEEEEEEYSEEDGEVLLTLTTRNGDVVGDENAEDGAEDGAKERNRAEEKDAEEEKEDMKQTTVEGNTEEGSAGAGGNMEEDGMDEEDNDEGETTTAERNEEGNGTGVDGLYLQHEDDDDAELDIDMGSAQCNVIERRFVNAARNLKIYTLSQGYPCWHLCRKFGITGMTGLNIWNYLGQNFTFLPLLGFNEQFIADARKVLEFLQIKIVLITQITEQEWYEAGITFTQLKAKVKERGYKKVDLQDFCSRAGMTKTHNKDTLCQMLIGMTHIQSLESLKSCIFFF